MSVTSTIDLIAAAGDRLTPSERRIAEAISADPTVLAFGTVSDLAERCGISRPTVVRFAHKLGFAGYTELQQHVRDDVADRLTSPSARIRSEAAAERDRGALEASLTATLRELTPDRLAALSAAIVKAETVWILSGETSRAAAHALRSGLSMLRPGVVLVDDHSVGRTVGGSDASDAAVVFDFHRYRRATQRAASALADRGVTVVAITDGPLSPLASLTDLWSRVEVPAVGPFDSSLPAVAVAELLVAQVARDMPEQATARIDATENLWAATGTFVD